MAIFGSVWDIHSFIHTHSLCSPSFCHLSCLVLKYNWQHSQCPLSHSFTYTHTHTDAHSHTYIFPTHSLMTFNYKTNPFALQKVRGEVNKCEWAECVCVCFHVCFAQWLKTAKAEASLMKNTFWTHSSPVEISEIFHKSHDYQEASSELNMQPCGLKMQLIHLGLFGGFCLQESFILPPPILPKEKLFHSWQPSSELSVWNVLLAFFIEKSLAWLKILASFTIYIYTLSHQHLQHIIQV